MKQYNQVFTTSLPVDLLAKELYRLLIQEINNIEPAQEEYYTNVTQAIIDPIADNSQACAHLFNTLNGWIKVPTPLDKPVMEEVEQAVQEHIEALNRHEFVAGDCVSINIKARNHREIQVDDYVSIDIDDIRNQTNYGELTCAGNTKVIGIVDSITNTDRINVKFKALRNYRVVEFYHYFTIEVLHLLPSLTGKDRLDKYNKSLADAPQP